MFTRAFIVLGGIIAFLLAGVAAIACFTTPVPLEWVQFYESVGYMFGLGAILVAVAVIYELTGR